MIELDQLNSILARAATLKIGLIGDLFLDRYLEISSTLHELSVETGLEAFQIQRIRNVAGALGTIINNLVDLGVGTVLPISVIGDDGHGYDLLQRLRQMRQVDTAGILQFADRLTPTYTKPIRPAANDTWIELNRLDVRSHAPLGTEATAATCRALRDAFDLADGWIVLDQVPEADYGVVNQQVQDELRRLADEHPGKLVYVDSRARIGAFDFATLKGNIHELTSATGHDAEQGVVSATEAAGQLSQRTGRPVFCTLGDQGLLVVEPGQTPHVEPPVTVDGPIDIVGAGDSATGGIVTSLLSGANCIEAASVANLVASITIQQIGTTGTARPCQVRARWAACQNR